jgi:hypothetical protein
MLEPVLVVLEPVLVVLEPVLVVLEPVLVVLVPLVVVPTAPFDEALVVPDPDAEAPPPPGAVLSMTTVPPQAPIESTAATNNPAERGWRARPSIARVEMRLWSLT